MTDMPVSEPAGTEGCDHPGWASEVMCWRGVHYLDNDRWRCTCRSKATSAALRSLGLTAPQRSIISPTQFYYLPNYLSTFSFEMTRHNGCCAEVRSSDASKTNSSIVAQEQLLNYLLERTLNVSRHFVDNQIIKLLYVVYISLFRV